MTTTNPSTASLKQPAAWGSPRDAASSLKIQSPDLPPHRPYVIFADVTLRHTAAKQPANKEDFAEIPGVGERKLRDFSGPFIEAIAKWRVQRPR